MIINDKKGFIFHTKIVFNLRFFYLNSLNPNLVLIISFN